jgi:bifunctional N-acetylglucosamine-1-phosphate-uridyltransferase/glucosamine-1-phosphate-acetyltransferase GlmU-like protein
MQAENYLAEHIGGNTLVLCGDAPFIDSETIRNALEIHENNGNAVTVITAMLDNPTGYGRIIRKGSEISGIVEQKDADDEQLEIKEINSGAYWFDTQALIAALKELKPENTQGEYYLTDTIPIDGVKCIELSFVPFTPESFGFTGRIYVPLGDSSLFIKQVKLNVPKSINLNYVENIYMTQDFEKAPDGTRLKVKDDMTVEFKLMPST